MNGELNTENYLEFRNNLYQETRELKLGRQKKSVILNDFSDWFKEYYEVNVLNFRFTISSSSKKKKFGLYVVLDEVSDYCKMVPNPYEQYGMDFAPIVAKFKELAQKHNYSLNKQIKNIFVVFVDFSKKNREEVYERAFNDIRKKIIKNFPSVCQLQIIFDAIAVFYYLDDDIVLNQDNGTSAKIKEMISEALKKYDEIHYCTTENLRVKFDSRECLEREYEGNTYYYIHNFSM